MNYYKRLAGGEGEVGLTTFESLVVDFLVRGL